MNKKTLLKGFTLIEMIIVMIIIGILAVVLTESYITISKTALRVEQEKNLSEESLILTQIFQAISDEATIDYEQYGGKLRNSSGFTDILYLTGGQWSGTSIYTTGGANCLELDWNSSMDDNSSDYSEKIQNALTGCSLVMKRGDEETSLITNGKVVNSNVMFKIIPYDSDSNYFSGGYEKDFKENPGFILNSIHQPAFWMFIHLYAPLYQPAGINKIDQPLQLFFNLNL